MAKPALVELLIQRKGGTVTPMPATAYSPRGHEYHFKPSFSDPRHTDWVEDPKHLTTFLGIEGYQLVDPLGAAPSPRGTINQAGATAQHGGQAAPSPVPETATIGSLNPTALSLEAIMAATGLTADDIRAKLGAEAAKVTDPVLDTAPPAGAPQDAAQAPVDPADPDVAKPAADPLLSRQEQLEAMPLQDLRALYTKVTGKNPSPKHDALILAQKIVLTEQEKPV